MVGIHGSWVRTKQSLSMLLQQTSDTKSWRHAQDDYLDGLYLCKQSCVELVAVSKRNCFVYTV